MIDYYASRKIIAQNGVPIHIIPYPLADNWYEVRIIFHGGAKFDPIGKEGTAHFFEHLPFRGTASYPSADAIRAVDREVFLDSLNAWTNMTQIVFNGIVRRSRETEAWGVFRELVSAPVFNPEEFERERSVVLQETHERVSSASAERMMKLSLRDLYGDHWLHRTSYACGWPDSVKAITLADLVEYRNNNFHTGNLEIVVVGDVKEADILEQVCRFASDIPAGERFAIPELHEPPLPQINRREISSSSDLGISGRKWSGVSVGRVFSAAWSGALTWFTGSMLTAFLKRKIRLEMSAAYGVSFERKHNGELCFMEIETKINPEMLLAVLKVFEDAFKSEAWLSEEARSSFEIEKRLKLERSKIYIPTPSKIADAAARILSTEGRILSDTEDREALEKVSFEDVVNFFECEFSPEKLYWYIVHP